MASQHIIELNGKRYDAVTGQIVPAKPHAPQKHTPKVPPTHHRNVDGFARPIKPIAHHQAQHSQTLVRKSVTPPKVTPKQTIATPKRLSGSGQKSQVVVPRKAVNDKPVPKSAMVRRFNEVVSTKAPAFASQSSQHLAAIAAPLRAITPPSSVATDHNPLAAGIFNAKSHEQPKFKRERVHKRVAKKLHVSPRVLGGGALMLAILVLGGFFTLQNLAGLNMRVAATRSGVQGDIPGYQPAGFSLSKTISYKPGEISLTYHSNSDDRNFAVIQATSEWNSATLLENFVAVEHPNYQTVTSRGKTVFLYDNNATWVDSGIWYRIEGDSKLNSDQLQNIANSL